VTRVLGILLLLLGWAGSALAGGGPENVLLVVNPDSPASLLIANHYAALRHIPATHWLFLPWNPKNDTTDIDTFREKILKPVLQAIQSRGLADQIDAVVYSCDFPWSVGLGSDIAKFTKELEQQAAARDKDVKDEKSDASKADKDKPVWPLQFTPVGSINGLTYLWPLVMARHPAYFFLNSNRYMRVATAERPETTSLGFRGNRRYDAQGEVVETSGQRYFLSTMLGVTTSRGNSPAEILSYLRRSAAADGTHPKGTIYFVQNSDIRSKVRHDLFPAAVRDLRKLGVAAEIIEGTIPLRRPDVQGAVMGVVAFDWKASGSRILPGAICEHFTSCGGIMTGNPGHTPLTEFLRYGAAGASGTVCEPYAILDKFPSPMIQVHYARGCTLAEAFYQSVHGPYQLLIVGDPLCRPWADIPKVSATGVEPGAAVRGKVAIRPSGSLPGGAACDHFELFSDGRRVAECKPGGTLTLDTSIAADGYHELRVVAVGPRPIESQGRQIIPVHVANHGRKITASLVGRGPWRTDKPPMIAVDSPGSVSTLVMYASHVVTRVRGAKGLIEIPPATLGAGPVRLSVVGLGNGDATTNVVADPLEFTLE
jgi:hypothetical protein